jgi:hypothetical protein
MPVTGQHGREPTGGNGPRGDAPSDIDVERRILRAVRSLDYGSVEVVVHDSRVVQIERREKVRFEKAAADPGGEPPAAPKELRPGGHVQR